MILPRKMILPLFPASLLAIFFVEHIKNISNLGDK